jgi:hypothetical protein
LFFQNQRSNFVARLKITGRSKKSKAEKLTAGKSRVNGMSAAGN